MPQRPPDIVPEIVQRDLTEEQLQAYLSARALSIDTETLGLQQLRDRLCLVQLCDEKGRGTIVQLARDQVISSTPLESRAPRLRRVLEDPKVLKVLHFARFDVAVLRHYLGIHLWPLYCTRTASKLVRTYTDRHGLKDVALELLDVELDKVTRHTDWRQPEPHAGPGPVRDLRRHDADPDHGAARRDAGARGTQGPRPRVLPRDPGDGRSGPPRLRPALRALTQPRRREQGQVARLRRQTIQVCAPGVSTIVWRTPLASSHACSLRLGSMRPSSVPQAIQSRRKRSFAAAARLGKVASRSSGRPPALKAPTQANVSSALRPT